MQINLAVPLPRQKVAGIGVVRGVVEIWPRIVAIEDRLFQQSFASISFEAMLPKQRSAACTAGATKRGRAQQKQTRVSDWFTLLASCFVENKVPAALFPVFSTSGWQQLIASSS